MSASPIPLLGGGTQSAAHDQRIHWTYVGMVKGGRVAIYDCNLATVSFL